MQGSVFEFELNSLQLNLDCLSAIFPALNAVIGIWLLCCRDASEIYSLSELPWDLCFAPCFVYIECKCTCICQDKDYLFLCGWHKSFGLFYFVNIKKWLIKCVWHKSVILSLWTLYINNIFVGIRFFTRHYIDFFFISLFSD